MKKGEILTPLRFKKCYFCDKVFSNRRKNKGVYGETQFAKKRCCSFSCAARSRIPLNEYEIIEDTLFIFWRDKTILADSKKKDLLLTRRWMVDSSGYAYSGSIAGKEKMIRMHCLLFGKKDGFVIDHKNNNKLDNRLSNLRFLTSAENISRCPARTQSGMKGVYFIKEKNKWRCELTFRKKHFHLGYFKKKEEAVEKRKEAEKIYLPFL